MCLKKLFKKNVKPETAPVKTEEHVNPIKNNDIGANSIKAVTKPKKSK